MPTQHFLVSYSWTETRQYEDDNYAARCCRMYESDTELCEGMLINDRVTAAGKQLGPFVHLRKIHNLLFKWAAHLICQLSEDNFSIALSISFRSSTWACITSFHQSILARLFIPCWGLPSSSISVLSVYLFLSSILKRFPFPWDAVRNKQRYKFISLGRCFPSWQ